MIERIEETTLGNLGGVEVAMANVTDDYTFILPDSTVGRGRACLLILPDEDVWVGVGSEVFADGALWKVIRLESPPGGSGVVTLERVH